MRDLTGLVAAITGVSAGIGEACTRALVAEGMNVAGGARRTDRLSALAEELGESFVPVIGLGFGAVSGSSGVAAFGKKYTISMVDDIGADNPLFTVSGPPPVGGTSYSSTQCLRGRHWRTGHH